MQSSPPLGRLSLCLSLAAVLAAACDRPEPSARLPIGAASPEAPSYSPWVIDVSGGEIPFDEISFKDVGLRSVPSAQRPAVYEAIARSVALELDADPSLPLQSTVRYSEPMTDPANHLSCAARHVYVDLWEGFAPSRWGYSLWSGCEEDAQFAWREVRRREAATGSASIATLTRSIAGSLREAIHSGCFTREC